MRIALDYDYCATADEQFWQEFVELAAIYGHSLVIVTNRDEDEPVENDLGLEVVHTEGMAIKRYCDELGIEIDVWIGHRPTDLLFNRRA